MKTYLENKAFNVTDGEKIYKVKSIEMYDSYDSIRLNLENVNDPEDTEQEICYIMQENIIECLKANGYEIIPKNGD